MAEDRTFTLIGRFDDQITKHLATINKEIAGVGKGLRSVTKDSEALSKSLRSLGRLSKDFSKTFERTGRDSSRAFRQTEASFGKLTDSMKGVQGGLQDMKAGFIAASEDSAASIRGIADSFQDVIAAAQNAAEAARGIGDDVNLPTGGRGGRDGGYTVRKGVYANLIASGVQTITGAAFSMARTVIGSVGGKVQEAVADELSDIATAGGIFSMGKVGKVKWADTYEKAFAIQRELEGRMAKLAAALPGETDDYVRNSKMVTDTVMNLGIKNEKGFVKVMKDIDGSVNTTKDAFLRGTEELAKYATLTDVVSPSGGLPFNQLVEQLISQEEINPNTLKRRYNAIKRNPLLSGAIDRNIEELNKAAAGTPERFQAMIKMLKEMYPDEVINAMQNSVDGITQTLKSSLFSMNTGLFGLKREIKVATAGFNTMHAGKEITTTLYDMGAKIYAAVGTILGPILDVLPMILDPIGQAMDILKEMYFNAENTLSNFKAAYKKFAGMKFDGKNLSAMDIGFRASMETIGKLAKAFGGDAKKIADLQGMLGGKEIDYGAAISKALDALFSSEAMDRLGYAIGKAMGTIVSDLAKMVESGKKVIDQSGLVAGFARGWQDGKGSEGIGKLLGDGIRLAFGAATGLLWEAFKKAPFETTVIVGLVTGIIPSMLGELTARLLAATAAKIAALNVGGYISGAVIPQAVAVATGIGTTVSGWMGTALVAVKAAAGGAAALTSTVVGGFMTFLGGIGTAVAELFTKLSGMLAFLANPVGIAVVITAAVGAFVYIFKDQIRGAIEMVAKWIEKNMTGPLKAALIGVTQVWKGIVNLIVGSIDWLIGLVTGDKKRMEAGGKAVSEGVSQFFSGWKAILQNAIGAMLQAGKAVADWAWKALTDAAKAFFSGLAGMVTGALKGLDGLQGNFISTIGGGVMGLARRVFTWLTGIQLPGQPTPTTPTTPNNQQPTPTPQKPQLPLPKPVNDGLNLFNWVKDKVGQPRYDGAGKSMPLLKAIGTEMANKPAGSDLVIANSSETVIPAAGGYGMDKLKEVFGSVATGFKAVNEQYQTLANGVTGLGRETQGQLQGIEQTNANRYRQTTRAISSNHQQTQQELATIAGNIASLGSQVATLSGTLGGFGGFFGSGAGAGGANKVVAVGKMLQAMGLRVAENPAFGDGRVGKHAPGSYHYSGRAIDVTGPAALLDQAYARLKATNPAELLWRTAGHYDHLHVAYALGAGKPAFFSSLKAAQQWEQAQIGDARISSVTTNSREMGAGDVVVNVGGVTVHSGNVTDPKELAYLVATEIGNAVNDAVNASIFV